MGGRKPNGRSSIYEGSDGRWHGWVTMGVKEDGSPDRRHRTGATETEVTNKVRKLTGLMTTSSKTGNFWQKKCVLIKNYSN